MKKICKKQICSETDYDFYTIPVPFMIFFKRKVRDFIYGELEKLHPCFSDDFTYDSKFRLIKNKLNACVVVMNKAKLAEYDKNLFIKEIKGKIFTDKKYGTFELLCLSLAFLIFMLSICAVIFKNQNATLNVNETSFVAESAVEAMFYEPDDSLVNLFHAVSNSQGKLKSLSWEADGLKEKLQASVLDLFPESLPDFQKVNMNFSPVNFDSGIPAFVVTQTNGLIQKKNIAETEALLLSENEFYQSFRKLLKDYNFAEEYEVYKPFTVRFVCTRNSQFFEAAAQLCKAAGFAPEKISISTIDKTNNLHCEFCFTDGEHLNSEMILSMIGSNLDVFMEASGSSESPVKSVISTNHTFRPMAKTQDNGTKVGSVKTPDGKIKTYYKTSEGKLRVRYDNE